MASSIGARRRLEAANARIDAAVQTLVPDAETPVITRNRAFGEVVRAEWLAATLEGLAGGQAVPADGDDLDEMTRAELNDEAARLGIEGADDLPNKAAVIAAIREVQD